MMARWIRLAAMEPAQFEAACVRLAAAQARNAPPALLWTRAATHYLFALVAPTKHAPGKAQRWLAWGVASAVATYRQFGVPAYLQEDGIWLHGRRIADGVARAVADCAVVSSSFLLQFPEKCVPMPSRELEEAFRLRLEAQHGWQFDTSWPTEPEKSFLYAPSYS